METIHLAQNKFVSTNGKETVNATERDLFSLNIPQMKGGVEELFNQNREFLLMKVHTDILSDSGIMINDTVVIDPLARPENDQVVILNLDNELLIRKYQKNHNRLTFYGENKKISPLQIEPGYDQFSIVGVVKYVIRSVE
jgi:SOS-response transcriptional repressor LexA